jgi:hypothetical protein
MVRNRLSQIFAGMVDSASFTSIYGESAIDAVLREHVVGSDTFAAGAQDKLKFSEKHFVPLHGDYPITR